MNICLDFGFTLAGGLIPYFKNMMGLLPDTDPENRYFVLVTEQGRRLIDDTEDRRKNVHYMVVRKAESNVYRFYWEQVKLPALLKRINADVYLSFNNRIPFAGTRCKKAVLLGTIGPFFPQFVDVHGMGPRIKYAILERLIVHSLIRSDLTIFESQYAAGLVAQKYGYKGKHVVNHHGKPNLTEEAGSDEKIRLVKRKFNIDADYFLYVTYVRKYKNLERLIEAYASIKPGMKKPIDFIVAGPPHPEEYLEELRSIARRFGVADSFRFIGMVDYYTDLRPLMRGCFAYMFPSKYENLSYALVEALTYGLPILTSTGTAMPETCGDAAIYFEPDDTQGMANAMLRIINENGLREGLREKSFSQAKHFRSIKEDILFYRETFKQLVGANSSA